MKLNKLVKSILKTAVYIMDQTANQVDRVSDRAVEMAENAREVVSPSESHALRNVLSFAAGVGVGVGAGLLLAPSSGSELRSSISGKVQDIGNRVKARGENLSTGTDLR
ncbi:MAG: YtxH domain-containing protein [Candidatus Sulfotelmatobacter sp.]|jgi:hypothetical protein